MSAYAKEDARYWLFDLELNGQEGFWERNSLFVDDASASRIYKAMRRAYDLWAREEYRQVKARERL